MSRRPLPRVVRRHDSLGRAYFTEVETGKCVSKEAWKKDVQRRHRAIERQERKERERAPRPQEPAPTGRAPERSFPEGVSEVGVPYDEEGDVPWFEVEDEADYEEKA